MANIDAKKYFEHLVALAVSASNLSEGMRLVYESVPVNVTATDREIRLTKCILIAGLMQLDPSVRKSVKRCSRLLTEKRAGSVAGDFVSALSALDL